MGQGQSIPWLTILASVTLGAIGQIMLKLGMRQVTAHTAHKIAETGIASILSMIKAIGNPWVFAGFCLYGVSSLIWLKILQKTPLSTAYPLISISYIMVVVLSFLILREPVKWVATIPGLILIMAGVSLIGIGMGGK